MKDKDYKKWHDLKIKVNNTEGGLFFHAREVWYCHLGENVGYEQDGKGDEYLRPVLIILKFNKDIFWGLPLTSNIKDSRYYCTISFNEGTKSSVILSQIRLIDAKRLSYMIGAVSHNDFRQVIARFKDLLP